MWFAKINLAFFKWDILKCMYLILQRMTLTAFQENATATLWRTFGAIPIQQCGMPQLFCDAIWPPRRLEFLPVLHAERQHIKLKTSLYLFRPDSIINQGKKNNNGLLTEGLRFCHLQIFCFCFCFFFISGNYKMYRHSKETKSHYRLTHLLASCEPEENSTVFLFVYFSRLPITRTF